MSYIERVLPREIFKVKTHDCFTGQITSESQVYDVIDEERVNPATGPIFVEGAQPGDLLKAEILDIEVDSKGVALIIPHEGVLGDKVGKSHTRIFDIVDNHVVFGDISIPIRPMIGVIGVAPSHEEGEYFTGLPWKHGGNMDTNDICKGSIVYLPVEQEGALLALGDCHGLMGDGEVGVTGLEVAGEVTLKVDIIKNKKITWPLVETSDYTMVIASGETLDSALYNATDEAARYLEKGLNISWEDAYILSSLAVDFKISQAVNENKTVRAAIPRSLIRTDLLIDSF